MEFKTNSTYLVPDYRVEALPREVFSRSYAEKFARLIGQDVKMGP